MSSDVVQKRQFTYNQLCSDYVYLKICANNIVFIVFPMAPHWLRTYTQLLRRHTV